MKFFTFPLLLLAAISPSIIKGDLVTDLDDGSKIITGFARINSKSCKLTGNEVDQLKNCNGLGALTRCNPSWSSETSKLGFWTTTDPDMTLKGEGKKTANCYWTWGITVDFKQIKDAVKEFKTSGGTGAAAGRNDLAEFYVFHASVHSVAGSPPVYVAEQVADMHAVVGQASNSGKLNVAFYRDGDIVTLAPTDFSLSWSCLIPPTS